MLRRQNASLFQRLLLQLQANEQAYEEQLRFALLTQRRLRMNRSLHLNLSLRCNGVARRLQRGLRVRQSNRHNDLAFQILNSLPVTSPNTHIQIRVTGLGKSHLIHSERKMCFVSASPALPRRCPTPSSERGRCYQFLFQLLCHRMKILEFDLCLLLSVISSNSHNQFQRPLLQFRHQ